MAGVLPQGDVQALGELVDGRFAGAVRVPAAGAVVGYGAHACGHEGEDGGVGKVPQGGKVGAAGGEERGEVFEEEEGSERVDFEGGERVGVGDCGWGLFRVENSRDAECEAEWGIWESGLAV